VPDAIGGNLPVGSGVGKGVIASRFYRLAVAVAGTGLATVAFALPAAAEGPTDATIEGAGLDATIRHPEAEDSKLAALTGLSAVWEDRDPTVIDDRAPGGDLGPALALTWELGEEGSQLRQVLYPYAGGGPLVFTPPQKSSDGAITGGWYDAPGALVDMLHSLGVPTESVLRARVGLTPVPGRDDLPELAAEGGGGTSGGTPAEPATDVERVEAGRDGAPHGDATDRPATSWLLVAVLAALATAWVVWWRGGGPSPAADDDWDGEPTLYVARPVSSPATRTRR
jgi:hypothetical protein